MSFKYIYEQTDYEGLTRFILISLTLIIAFIAIAIYSSRSAEKNSDSISPLKGEQQVGIIIINEKEFRFDGIDSFKSATKDMNIDKYEHVIVNASFAFYCFKKQITNTAAVAMKMTYIVRNILKNKCLSWKKEKNARSGWSYFIGYSLYIFCNFMATKNKVYTEGEKK
jgi:hypothetical protein